MMKNPTFDLVSLHDPAWGSVEITALSKYANGGGQPEDLPTWPDGVEPIVFTCKRLTRSVIFDHVEGVSSERGRAYRAFTFGVVKIRGGRFGEGWEPESARGKKGATHISEEELDESELSPNEIADIGGAIYARSTDPKGSAPRYPRQPSSLDAWGASARRYAAQRPPPAPPNNEQHKGE